MVRGMVPSGALASCPLSGWRLPVLISGALSRSIRSIGQSTDRKRSGAGRSSGYRPEPYPSNQQFFGRGRRPWGHFPDWGISLASLPRLWVGIAPSEPLTEFFTNDGNGRLSAISAASDFFIRLLPTAFSDLAPCRAAQISDALRVSGLETPLRGEDERKPACETPERSEA